MYEILHEYDQVGVDITLAASMRNGKTLSRSQAKYIPATAFRSSDESMGVAVFWG